MSLADRMAAFLLAKAPEIQEIEVIHLSPDGTRFAVGGCAPVAQVNLHVGRLFMEAQRRIVPDFGEMIEGTYLHHRHLHRAFGEEDATKWPLLYRRPAEDCFPARVLALAVAAAREIGSIYAVLVSADGETIVFAGPKYAVSAVALCQVAIREIGRRLAPGGLPVLHGMFHDGSLDGFEGYIRQDIPNWSTNPSERPDLSKVEVEQSSPEVVRILMLCLDDHVSTETVRATQNMLYGERGFLFLWGNTWLVKTTKTDEQMAQVIRPHTGCWGFLVTEVSVENMQGMLPDIWWQWIKK